MIQSILLNRFPEFFHAFLEKEETLSSLNIPGGKEDLIALLQVHSGNVALASSKTPLLKDTDGIVLKKKGWSGIKTADCVPVILYDPKLKTGAAVHAGWKGLSKRIVSNAIKLMKKLGSDPRNIHAAIGPHIRVCCYDVPHERISIFEKMGFDKNEIGEQRGKKWYLNLEKIVLSQMKNEEIPLSNIDSLSLCTYTNGNFSSNRRDGKLPGILNNIIGFT